MVLTQFLLSGLLIPIVMICKLSSFSIKTSGSGVSVTASPVSVVSPSVDIRDDDVDRNRGDGFGHSRDKANIGSEDKVLDMARPNGP